MSPIFLVRIFDLKQYGEYQKFNLYAIIFIDICSFGISSNLLYFLNKYPQKLKVLVSNTAAYLFCASLIGIIAVYSANNILFGKNSINFLFPLCVFIFFSLNMAFWDVFWLAMKKVHYVLYYSVSIMLIKITGVILIAYFFRNVEYVIWWLCIVQICRFSFVLINGVKRKWFTLKCDKDIMKKQFNYFYPIGTAGTIRSLNAKLSNIFVVQLLGIEALAIYSIGSRNLPVTTLFRSSIVDTVFPDVVERGTKSDSMALLLWQKTNVMITIAIAPIFTVGMYYAEEIIKIIFTSQYIQAVPIFRIYLFLMILQTLEFTMPIRNKNKNVHIIIAGTMRLTCNAILISILMFYFGILGAATAAVISGLVEFIYLGYTVNKLYSKNIKELLMWKKEIKILSVSIGGLIFLWVGQIVLGSNVGAAILNTILYLCVYLILLWKLNIEEFIVLLKWLRTKFDFFCNKCFI